MKNFSIFFFAIIITIAFSKTVVGQDSSKVKTVMKRYVVERTFPEGINIPMNEKGCQIVLGVISNNTEEQVTWIHSYVSADKKKTFCIYDAPSPEAIRKVAEKNGIPVDNITEVKVFDPYFYN
jgi:hypothetical protein